MERQEKIGELIRGAYSELDGKKRGAHWGAKLEASGYVRHRDCYVGTEVPEVKLYTSSPEIFYGKYISGIVGYLFPRSQQWARWVHPIGVGQAKRTDGQTMILDKTLSSRMEAFDSVTFTALSSGNFYSEIKNVMNDWGSFGFGCMSVFDRNGKPAFRSEDPQRFVVDDNEYRELECYIRRFELPSRRVVALYGDSCELKASRDLAKGGYTGEMCYTRLYEAVFERGYFIDYETGEPFEFAGSKRYVHIVFSEDDYEVLSEGGYDEMPMAVPCRNRDSEKCYYGHGLAEDCLPDMKQLNDAENRKQIALQKISDPPMYVPYALEGTFSTRPRSVVYGPDMTQAPRPIQTIADYSGILSDVAERKEELKYKMDVTLFETVMSSGDSRKTATEVTMQENKSILLLALNIDNLLHELIEPILKRTLKIILRNMPIVEKDDVAFYDEEIRYVDEIHLELNSVFVKRLNAYIQAEGLQSSLQTLQMLCSISPESIQAVDTDNYARLLLASSGLPATLIKSEEELQKQREEMAKLQQMQLEMQQQMANAQTNVDNAKAQSLLEQGQE